VLVEVDDAGRAERHRHPGGVQPDRGQPGARPDDQHLRPRLVAQARADAAPPVGQVVARAGDGDGVEPGGERHEHGLGVRHRDDVGQQPAPLQPAERAEPVARQEGVARAGSGAPAPARRAGAAGDLEGHDDPVPGATDVTAVPTSSTSATPSCPSG
jgi:hypothetical protein